MHRWNTRRRPRGPPPSQAQILQVARDAVSTLKSMGVDCCFLGSMGCTLFGTTRKPNDLDILCLTDVWDQEALKRQLVALNTQFYRVPSRDPTANYTVLWYHIFETDSCVKVDLLLPGVLDIPNVPLSEIDHGNSAGLPCTPLSLLLLLKLQGWIHHGESAHLHHRRKQPIDELDINQLLDIACDRAVLPLTESYIPQDFISRTKVRVEKYVRTYPVSTKKWMNLGFSFPETNKTANADRLLEEGRIYTFV